VVRVSIGFMMIQASLPGFLALFMRDELGWSDSQVLLIGACITIGVIFTASLWGRVSDVAGSRPLMRLSTFCQLIPLSYWALCAGGVASADPVAFGLVNMVFGIFLGAQTVAMIRLSLWGCPDHETTIGMMTYQVLVSLTGGVSVLTWGFILRGLRGVFPPMAEAGYSGTFFVFFLFAIFILLILQLFIGRVPETKAITSRDLLIQMLWGFPLRVLSGFVPEQDRDDEE
jgi:MFS-type transporter involved in bile tolerance (Atg22 family)